MTAGTFRRGRGGIDRSGRRCSECGRSMVSRGRYAELVPEEPPRKRVNGVFVADETRVIVRHAAHGVCTSCIDKVKPRERASRTDWREEWDFLKGGGTSPEEAARRLGITPETIRTYERTTTC